MVHRPDPQRIAAYGAAGSIAVVNAVVVLALVYHVAAGAAERASDVPLETRIEAADDEPHPREAEAIPAGPARR